MSTDAGELTGSGGEGVDDPSDLKQRRRIEALLRARERVAEQSRKALDFQAKGQVGDTLARRMVRQAVEEYALESEHVIRSHLPNVPRGETPNFEDRPKKQEAAWYVWNDVELGALDMNTDVKEFRGLHSFVEAPRVIEETWTETTGNPVGGAETSTHRATHEIPMEVSKRAYRALNYFWHQVGMDIEMETKRPFDDWSEEYEDGVYE